MTNLTNHQSNKYTKMILIGDSKSGKTGALASLVCAGYKLRILDYDNGLDPLKTFVEKNCPTLLKTVEYRTLRDKVKSTPLGTVIDGSPKAFVDGIKMLDKWKYKDGEEEIDLGPPSEWGPECILVIDSLTFMSEAAFNFREPLAVRGKDGRYDNRMVYFDAQKAIMAVLSLLSSDSFRTNVIVISHIRYVENEEGRRKGYPTAIGEAISTRIPQYFNTMALFETGQGGKRTLKTVSTAIIDLANPKPFDAAPAYSIETGMAEFFAVLRETKPKDTHHEQTKLQRPSKRAR